MPLPRPLLVVLLGAVLIGAAFFASRGLSGTSDSSGSEVTPAPEADTGKPVTPEQPKAKTTTDIRQALRGSEAVTSGTFSFSFGAADLELTADGKFQSRGLAEVPQFDIDLQGRRGGRTIDVGAVSDGKRGYLVSGDGATVVAARTWDSLVRARTQGANRGPSKDDLNNYSKKELDSFEFRGEETLEGAPVLHFAGQVDPKRSQESFGEIADGFAKTGLNTPLPGVLARTVKGGTINVWVGADDHLVRRERVVFRYSGGEATYELRRGNLNQPQQIAAPPNAKSGSGGSDSLGLAFTALVTAVFAVEPAEGRSESRVQRSESRPQRSESRSQPSRERSRKPARPAGVTPAAVRRAVAQRRIVILFFRQRGADDDAVAGAVNSVRGRSGVSVFVLPVGKAPKYADVGASTVTRAPTLVLLRRGDDPRTFEGFIDSTTLAQAVTDAR